MPAGSPTDRARRPYHRSGLHVVTRALPYLTDRITDRTVPDGDLSPVERAARNWRHEVLADLGGLDAVPAAKVALLDAATGSKVILDSLDRYVFALATTGGLVSRRTRTAFRVVADRMRVADGLARQLQALGLDRRERPPLDLASYLAARHHSALAPRESHETREDEGEPVPGTENAPGISAPFASVTFVESRNPWPP